MINCPYCGAEPINDENSQWECGSYICFGPTQASRCRIRELEQQNAKLGKRVVELEKELDKTKWALKVHNMPSNETEV